MFCMSVGRSKSEKSEPSVLELTQGLEVYIAGIDHKSDLALTFFCEYYRAFLKLNWAKGYAIQAAQRLN